MYKFKHPLQRVGVDTIVVGESRTKQSFTDECDLNTILMRWEKTGILGHANGRSPKIGVDLTKLPSDYHSALNSVIEAQGLFDELPSKVRARFKNDPGSFLEFVSDPENNEEMVRMGLATVRSDETIAPIAGQIGIPGSGVPSEEPPKKKKAPGKGA